VEPDLSRIISRHSLFKILEIYEEFNQDVRDSAENDMGLYIGRYILKEASVIESNCNMTTPVDKCKMQAESKSR
jgi:hypothetical protein